MIFLQSGNHERVLTGVARYEWWDNAGAGSVRLSQTGNQTAYQSGWGNPSSSPTLTQTQTRTHLGRNEPDAFTDSVSGNPDPQYQAAKAGMTTRDDTTALSGYGYRYTYDAWGRLVKATTPDNSATVSEYRYNGLGHRIASKARHIPTLTYANNPWRYHQHNERWQHVASFKGTSSSNGACSINAVESYLYDAAGLDGRGGSSYIDRLLFRERDADAGVGSDASWDGTPDGVREERHYYLQNWRHDVTAIINPDGSWVERYRYDAYGRPSSFSVADLTGNNGTPDGVVDAADQTAFDAAYLVGVPDWKTDLGSPTSGKTETPDNAVTGDDDSAYKTYKVAPFTGGIGLQSGLETDNQRGLAGYAFDPVLNGTGKTDGDGVPLYHVRHLIFNSATGKPLQPQWDLPLLLPPGSIGPSGALVEAHRNCAEATTVRSCLDCCVYSNMRGSLMSDLSCAEMCMSGSRTGSSRSAPGIPPPDRDESPGGSRRRYSGAYGDDCDIQLVENPGAGAHWWLSIPGDRVTEGLFTHGPDGRTGVGYWGGNSWATPCADPQYLSGRPNRRIGESYHSPNTADSYALLGIPAGANVTNLCRHTRATWGQVVSLMSARESATLKYGPNAGTSCQRATCSDIEKCLFNFKPPQSHTIGVIDGGGDSPTGYNCRHAAEDAMRACCLKKCGSDF